VLSWIFLRKLNQKGGSALYLKGGSNFTVRGTSFKNNTGGGNFISVADMFNDGGGNTGSGNVGACGANGAFVREEEKCVYFNGIGTDTNFTDETDEPTKFTVNGTYPLHPVPKNPPPGYFNYDMDDLEYGPTAWHKIPATQTDAYKYWKDLEEYMPADMTENTCDSKKSFNENRASPVNLRNTDDNCKEFHQFRPNRKVSGCRNNHYVSFS